MERPRDLIEAWPSIRAFASDLGVTLYTASQWRTRNAIPARHWLALSRAAKGRALQITPELIEQLHTKRAQAAA